MYNLFQLNIQCTCIYILENEFVESAISTNIEVSYKIIYTMQYLYFNNDNSAKYYYFVNFLIKITSLQTKYPTM